MSALFQLDYSGPQTSCDFPGCRLDSFHDGDHLFDAPPKSALETANRKMEKARPHESNQADLAGRKLFCWACAHRVDLPKELCDCRKCRTQGVPQAPARARAAA